MTGKTENLAPRLVEAITAIEALTGMNLIITSGHRSLGHNVLVGGVENSEHTYPLAEGVDILCRKTTTRYKLLAAMFELKIRRIGIGREFLHLGVALDKPQDVVWHYYPTTPEETLVEATVQERV